MNEHPPAQNDSRQYQWRVAIVEDHLLQRRSTEALIAAQTGLRVAWSGESLPDFDDWLALQPEGKRPHLLILDLMVERGPSVDPDRVRAIVRSGIRVLVLSAMASPELVRKVLKAGVGGIAGKRDSEENIVAAAWTILGRGQWLTPELAAVIAGDADRPKLSDQEERALVLYASGLTLAAVAEAIGVKQDTAKKYLSRVKNKYAEVGRPANTKLDLHKVAQQDGYLDPPAPG